MLCGFIGIVQPVVFGVVWGLIRRRGFDRKMFKCIRLDTLEEGDAPTAWDAVFLDRPESWIIVTLKDNTRVRGWFGVGSHASSDETKRDLYISRVVVLREDGKNEFVKNTGGVYISAEEIRTIEFINDQEETK